MLDTRKYKIKTSRLYEKIRTTAYDAGVQITTANRIWVTNPDNVFGVIKNCGEKIKKRGY